MKMIKLHKGNGKPQLIDFNALCLDYVKKTFLKITPQADQRGVDPVDRGDNLAVREKKSRTRDKNSRVADKS